MNNGRHGPLRRHRFSARQLRLFGTVGLVVYVVLSTSIAFVIKGPTTHPSKEFYPFFTWSLFSQVSDRRNEYHIAVFSLDGQSFDPPADMRSIDEFPRFADSKSLGYKALQNVGEAFWREAEDSASKLDRFAERFFGRHNVDYEINRHRYNPLQRWREGPSTDKVTLIGRFTHEGRS